MVIIGPKKLFKTNCNITDWLYKEKLENKMLLFQQKNQFSAHLSRKKLWSENLSDVLFSEHLAGAR